jgi:hypothetical protein
LQRLLFFQKEKYFSPKNAHQDQNKIAEVEELKGIICGEVGKILRDIENIPQRHENNPHPRRVKSKSRLGKIATNILATVDARG